MSYALSVGGLSGWMAAFPGTEWHSGDHFMFKRQDIFVLIATGTSFLYSIGLWFGAFGAPNKDAGLFVGIWVPSILSLACFAKLAENGQRHE